MSQDPYDKARDTLTELQSVTPPYLAADGQVMTVRTLAIPAFRRTVTPAGPVSGTSSRAKWSSRCRANRREWSRPARRSGNPAEHVIHYQDANNRTDIPLRFVVTMIMAPGQPMLVFVEDGELKQSGWVRRSPA